MYFRFQKMKPVAGSCVSSLSWATVTETVILKYFRIIVGLPERRRRFQKNYNYKIKDNKEEVQQEDERTDSRHVDELSFGSGWTSSSSLEKKKDKKIIL